MASNPPKTKAVKKVKACHCGKDGHALNSVNCPVHGWRAVKAWAYLDSDGSIYHAGVGDTLDVYKFRRDAEAAQWSWEKCRVVPVTILIPSPKKKQAKKS
jgi:hypothetical protein